MAGSALAAIFDLSHFCPNCLARQGRPTVRAICILWVHHALALRTARAQLVVALGTKIETVLHGMPTLRAVADHRLAENEIQNDSQAVGHQDGNRGPEGAAHASPSRVTIHVANQQQVTAQDETDEQAQQNARPGGGASACRATTTLNTTCILTKPIAARIHAQRATSLKSRLT